MFTSARVLGAVATLAIAGGGWLGLAPATANVVTLDTSVLATGAAVTG